MFLLDTYPLFKYTNKLVDAPANVTSVAATNEMPVDEPANETPAVVTSAMPVEQANEAPVAPNNQMSITVPPHLLGVVPNTTNSMVQINFYADLPLKSLVKFNGSEIEIDQSNEACLPQGPPFFKWAIENLLHADMIKSIHDEAPLEAAKLKTLVRGIRPRVDAKANPREGEPTDYVLVLGDIIGAHKSVAKPLRAAFNMYKNGELSKYKSACFCNIENETNGTVSLH